MYLQLRYLKSVYHVVYLSSETSSISCWCLQKTIFEVNVMSYILNVVSGCIFLDFLILVWAWKFEKYVNGFNTTWQNLKCSFEICVSHKNTTLSKLFVPISNFFDVDCQLVYVFLMHKSTFKNYKCYEKWLDISFKIHQRVE